MKKVLIVFLATIAVCAYSQNKEQALEMMRLANKQVFRNNDKSAFVPVEILVDSVITYEDTLMRSPSMKQEFIFEDKQYSEIDKEWDTDSNKWDTYQKAVYSHSGSLVKMKYQPFYGGIRGGLPNGPEYLYMYATGDTCVVTSRWSDYHNDWILEYKTSHYYNNEGVDTLSVTYSRDTINNMWVFNHKTTVTFFEGEKDSLHLKMYYINEGDTFDVFEDMMYTYSYNQNNQIITLIENWNGYFSQDSLLYDLNGNCTFEYSADWENDWNFNYLFENRFDTANKLVKELYWDKQDGQTDWESDGMAVFFYATEEEEEENPNSLMDNHSIDFSVYPNPANNTIHLKGTTGLVSIFNQLGSLVLQTQIEENGQELQVGNLSEGVYIIQVTNGNQTITKQFIKK